MLVLGMILRLSLSISFILQMLNLLYGSPIKIKESKPTTIGNLFGLLIKTSSLLELPKWSSMIQILSVAY